MNVVRSYLGADALGLFTASTKFCVVVTFVVSVFHLAWQEITYSLSDNQDKKETYTNGLNVFMDISMVGTLALLPLVKIVFPYFIGAEFAASSAYVPAYYSTVFFTAISGFQYNTLAAENITIFHPITKLVSAAVNLTIMYTMIGTIGIYAVIIGAVASAAVEAFVLTVVMRKKIGLRFGFYKVFLFAVCYLLGCVLYNNFGVGVNAVYMVLMIFLGIAYFLLSNRHMVKAVLHSFKKA
jgi:O-antigen/teichoic acid export membrane protein